MRLGKISWGTSGLLFAETNWFQLEAKWRQPNRNVHSWSRVKLRPSIPFGPFSALLVRSRIASSFSYVTAWSSGCLSLRPNYIYYVRMGCGEEACFSWFHNWMVSLRWLHLPSIATCTERRGLRLVTSHLHWLMGSKKLPVIIAEPSFLLSVRSEDLGKPLLTPNDSPFLASTQMTPCHLCLAETLRWMFHSHFKLFICWCMSIEVHFDQKCLNKAARLSLRVFQNASLAACFI